jgi:multiple RNA-binding domain-containing protein 1
VSLRAGKSGRWSTWLFLSKRLESMLNPRSAYGQLKSLRLPRKSTALTPSGAASTRGFAFLEYTTHAEASRAIEALKHTHLLGRHLVLEWAKAGDTVDVEGLREKVGRDWRGMMGEGGERKKRKLELGLGGDGPGGAREDMDGLEG